MPDGATPCHLTLQVVSLESEPQGEIPPYGMAPLNWRFAPLGATAYSVVLNVLLGDGSSQAITLQVRCERGKR